MDTKAFQQESLFDFQKNLLKDEILIIHSKITAYNDFSLKIKGWAVTIWSAIVIYGAEKDNYIIVLASLPSLVAFWILDAIFKRNLNKSIYRMRKIEDFFYSNQENQSLRLAFEKENFENFPYFDPIGRETIIIYGDKEKYIRSLSLWHCLKLPNISIIYVFLILSSISAFLLINHF